MTYGCVTAGLAVVPLLLSTHPFKVVMSLFDEKFDVAVVRSVVAKLYGYDTDQPGATRNVSRAELVKLVLDALRTFADINICDIGSVVCCDVVLALAKHLLLHRDGESALHYLAVSKKVGDARALLVRTEVNRILTATILNNAFDKTGKEGDGPKDTVRERFAKRKMYDPVWIAGRLMGADETPRKKFKDKFLDALPVVGYLNRYANPEPEEERPRVEPLVRGNDVFDSTKGYEGEGPPKNQQRQQQQQPKQQPTAKALRRRRQRQRRRERKQQGQSRPVNNQQQRAGPRPAMTVFAQPVRTQNFRMVDKASRFTGKVFLNAVNSTVVQYNSVLGTTNGTTGTTPYLPLNPYSVSALGNTAGVTTQLASACDFKKKWRGRFKIVYEATCEQSAPGALTQFFDPDSADSESEFLGTAQIMNVAAEHNSTSNQVFVSRSWEFKTTKNMWLRQSQDSDIRTVVLGNFYLFTSTGILPETSGEDTIMLMAGNLSIEYDIELLEDSSNERLYILDATTSIAVTGAGVAYASIPNNTTNWKLPRSEVLQPALAAPTTYAPPINGADVLTTTQGINCCANDVVPTASYFFLMVDVAVASGLLTALTALFYVNGVESSATWRRTVAFTVSTGSATSCWAFQVPAGQRAGSVQLIPAATVSGTSVVVFTIRIVPSVRFTGDSFNPMLVQRHRALYSLRLPVSKDDEKHESDNIDDSLSFSRRGSESKL